MRKSQLRFLTKSQIPQPLLSKPVDYPSGVFIHTEKGYFYIAGSDKRYRCLSKRVLDSWAPQRVIETTEAAVSKYRIAAKLKFRNGSLIHNIADGKVYLISDGKRRHVTSPDAFDMLNAKRDRKHVMSVSQAEINLHDEGEPLA